MSNKLLKHTNGQWFLKEESLEKTDRASKQRRQAEAPEGAVDEKGGQFHRPKAEGEQEAEQLREKISAPDKPDVENFTLQREKEKTGSSLSDEEKERIKAAKKAKIDDASNKVAGLKTPKEVYEVLKRLRVPLRKSKELVHVHDNGQWQLLH